MRLKKEPIKPTRYLNQKKYYNIEENETLADLYKMFPDGIIDVKRYWYEDNVLYRIKYFEDETDEEYQKRYDSFLKRKKAYDSWYCKNKKEIEAELENRRQSEKIQLERHLANVEAEQKRLFDSLEKKKRQIKRKIERETEVQKKHLENERLKVKNDLESLTNTQDDSI